MANSVGGIERIKADSRRLRGTLSESIADPLTGALAPDDTQICKFHGFYQQDDRDSRQDRQARRLEPYYSFMLRARLPGGVCTPRQWLVLDELCRELADGRSLLRRNSMACVSLPTCPLAMAEAERYFPSLLDKIEDLSRQNGLDRTPLVMRMTGRPNGCVRPFVAELGLVGKGPGRYNLYLGGDGAGARINKLYRENIKEAEILATIEELFRRFKAESNDAERFGDFVVRSGIVPRVENPATDFHS